MELTHQTKPLRRLPNISRTERQSAAVAIRATPRPDMLCPHYSRNLPQEPREPAVRVTAAYQQDPALLQRHLAHRQPAELESVPQRLGWLTWEQPAAPWRLPLAYSTADLSLNRRRHECTLCRRAVNGRVCGHPMVYQLAFKSLCTNGFETSATQLDGMEALVRARMLLLGTGSKSRSSWIKLGVRRCPHAAGAELAHPPFAVTRAHSRTRDFCGKPRRRSSRRTRVPKASAPACRWRSSTACTASRTTRRC